MPKCNLLSSQTEYIRSATMDTTTMSNHTGRCSCHLTRWQADLHGLQSLQVVEKLQPRPGPYGCSSSALMPLCWCPRAGPCGRWSQSLQPCHRDSRQCSAPSLRGLTWHQWGSSPWHHICGCGSHHRQWREHEGPLGRTPWTLLACGGPRGGAGTSCELHHTQQWCHPWTRKLKAFHQDSRQPKGQTCHCPSYQGELLRTRDSKAGNWLPLLSVPELHWPTATTSCSQSIALRSIKFSQNRQ